MGEKHVKPPNIKPIEDSKRNEQLNNDALNIPLTKMARNILHQVGVFVLLNLGEFVRCVMKTHAKALRSQLPCRTSTVYPE